MHICSYRFISIQIHDSYLQFTYPNHHIVINSDIRIISKGKSGSSSLHLIFTAECTPKRADQDITRDVLALAPRVSRRPPMDFPQLGAGNMMILMIIKIRNKKKINGNFRILKWRYCTLPCFRPYFLRIYPEI